VEVVVEVVVIAITQFSPVMQEMAWHGLGVA